MPARSDAPSSGLLGKPPGEPLRVFCSYSQMDQAFLETLHLHIRALHYSGIIDSWSDRDIAPGAELQAEIDLQLEQADLILLLISANFLGSDRIWNNEMRRALDRHKRGAARVIPILLKPTDWQHTPFGHLKPLPDQGRAITLWENQDEAWTQVAKGIRKVALEMRERRNAAWVRPADATAAASASEVASPLAPVAQIATAQPSRSTVFQASPAGKPWRQTLVVIVVLVVGTGFGAGVGRWILSQQARIHPVIQPEDMMRALDLAQPIDMATPVPPRDLAQPKDSAQGRDLSDPLAGVSGVF